MAIIEAVDLGKVFRRIVRRPGITGAIGALFSREYEDKVAVDHVNFSLAEGELVGYLGPNGAGKSTTIDMMLGLARPDSGAVRLFGRSPSEAVAEGRVGGMLQARRDFWEAMRAIAKSGKTVVFATHHLEEADAYADRIVVMARPGSDPPLASLIATKVFSPAAAVGMPYFSIWRRVPCQSGARDSRKIE